LKGGGPGAIGAVIGGDGIQLGDDGGGVFEICQRGDDAIADPRFFRGVQRVEELLGGCGAAELA